MALIGRQFVITGSSEFPLVDYIFPFYTVYEFVIYIGWLKVAQASRKNARASAVVANSPSLSDDAQSIRPR